MMKKYIFKPSRNFSIPYFANKTVFKPNLTSELIVQAIEKNKKKINCKKILDLGCGSGVIGIAIKKKIFKSSDIYFSDISKNAIRTTEKNCKLNKIKYIAKTSNLMTEWKNQNFDLIINDVSAISSFFSKKKIWYNDFIPSDTGLDGTKQVAKFLAKIKVLRLNNVIIPMISLCDTAKIKTIIKDNKFTITTLLKKDWPMPKNFVYKHRKELLSLKNKKKISFSDIYGFFVASTEILYLKKKK